MVNKAAAPIKGHCPAAPGSNVRHRTDAPTGSAETPLHSSQPEDANRIPFERGPPMLYTVALVLIVLWLLGLVTSYTLGGFIHLLLVIAVIVVLLRIISGRRVL